VAGTFTYSPAAGAVLKAGQQTLSVSFAPTDTTHYTSATGSVTLTVTPVAPVVSWATPAGIAYGTALGAAQLDATASTPGTFAYTPASGTVLKVGSQQLSVTFTPTDTTDYTTATAGVTLAVSQTTPAITWATPAAITYGTALSATQLDATANAAGAFVYTPASGTVLKAGSQPLSVSFTPTDTTDYSSATGQVTLTVSQATPVITWATPAAIVAGTALSSTQLDATASVPGTFVYNPASGTTLSTVGTTQLGVTFTPTDATDYTTATDSVSLTVGSNQPASTVDFGTQEQRIRGFGGSTAWLGTMPQAVASALFDPNGLNLSILRVRIDPSSTTGGANWAAELANAQEAVADNPNAIVFATPWTAPAAWKTDAQGELYNGETAPGSPAGTNPLDGGSLNTADYADYANYLDSFVNYMATAGGTYSNGVNLYAISMQNEPEENVSYESCVWTGAQMDTWVAGNASVITADPNYPTKLIMPESEDFNTAFTAPIFTSSAVVDPTADNLISIIGGHIYQYPNYGQIVPYSIPAGATPKEVWMTEFGPLTTYQPPFPALTYADMLPYAEAVHDSLAVGQYNAFVWWGIFGAPTAAGSYGLVDNSGNPTVFGYAMGQYSKFVQPGYYRYSATAKPSASVYVSAFAGTEGSTQHYVIVAINAGATAIAQPFTIQNAADLGAIFTPYQTISTAFTASGSGLTGTGLTVQPVVTVSNGQFTYTLPAQSITTFVQ
jgi:O-glycosyl hydrolase